MSDKKDREAKPEPDMVEDIPPQVLEDESAWNAEVYEKLVKPGNPKLAKAVDAAAKRIAELEAAKQKKPKKKP